MNKFLFVHIPKTGGKVVRAFLRKTLIKNGYILQYLVYPHTQPQTLWTNWRDANKYRAFIGHFPYCTTKLLDPDIDVVTVLRHPINRAVSHYQHVLQNEDHYFFNIALEKTFIDFLNDATVRPVISNVQTRYLGYNVLPEAFQGYQQHDYLKAFELADIDIEQAYDNALENIENIAYIGFQEALYKDVRDMAKVLGLSPGVHIPEKQSDYTAELSDTAFSILQELNEYDLRIYDHVRTIRNRRADSKVL